MKRVFLSLFVLGFSFFAADPCQAALLRISAPKIELDLSPGESYSGEVSVENPDPEEAKLKIYMEDWAYSSGVTGEKQFAPAGTMPLSSVKWISYAPALATMPPYSKTVVRYTIQVPQDAKGGHYSVLFFETMIGTSTSEGGASVIVAGRIGSLFYIRPKGTIDRRGEIVSVHVEAPSGSKPMTIETVFKNSGNTDITLGGNFLIMNEGGNILGRGDIAKIYTFPGDTESRSTQWVGRLPKGAYSLLLTYDLGEGKSLVKEETLNVS